MSRVQAQARRFEQAFKPTAYVIDDDRDVRVSLSVLLSAKGWAARPFATADDFIDELPFLSPGCILLDIRMPGRDGLSLMSHLSDVGVRWPAIVMTGHGEVSIAVEAMKLGAIEFLEKPFSEESLGEALQRGSAMLSSWLETEAQSRWSAERIANLSSRERDVLNGILAGRTNRAIAETLGLSPRTVEMHRAAMLRRLGVTRLAEVIAIASAAGLQAVPQVQ